MMFLFIIHPYRVKVLRTPYKKAKTVEFEIEQGSKGS